MGHPTGGQRAVPNCHGAVPVPTERGITQPGDDDPATKEPVDRVRLGHYLGYAEDGRGQRRLRDRRQRRAERMDRVTGRSG